MIILKLLLFAGWIVSIYNMLSIKDATDKLVYFNYTVLISTAVILIAICIA